MKKNSAYSEIVREVKRDIGSFKKFALVVLGSETKISTAHDYYSFRTGEKGTSNLSAAFIEEIDERIKAYVMSQKPSWNPFNVDKQSEALKLVEAWRLASRLRKRFEPMLRYKTQIDELIKKIEEDGEQTISTGVVGAIIGGSVGMIFGPLGAAIGASLLGATGGVVGAASEDDIKKINAIKQLKTDFTSRVEAYRNKLIQDFIVFEELRKKSAESKSELEAWSDEIKKTLKEVNLDQTQKDAFVLLLQDSIAKFPLLQDIAVLEPATDKTEGTEEDPKVILKKMFSAFIEEK